MSTITTESDREIHAYSERTLAIIKPEAYENAEDIENHIRDHGFMILAISVEAIAPVPTEPYKIPFLYIKQRNHIFPRREVRLTAEQAAELYRGHYGHHHFPHLVAHMSSGPIIAMVLATRNCIQKWRVLLGPARVAEAQAYWPDSLRACYGRRTKYGDYFNALHGSENYAEALREIHFFFPTMVIGPLLRHWQVGDYIQKHLTSILLPALTALAQERPAEPILWLADYIKQHNTNEPEISSKSLEEIEEKRCHTPSPSELSLAK